MVTVALSEKLSTLLADLVTFSFQLQGCHWNVEGPDFSQYHALFGTIYEDVSGSIDPVAENIRKLDEYVPFQLQEFVKLRSVEFSGTKPDPKAMSQSVLKVNEGVLKSLNDCFKQAEKEDQQGIADFLAGRIDMHQKWRWFLTASSK